MLCHLFPFTFSCRAYRTADSGDGCTVSPCAQHCLWINHAPSHRYFAHGVTSTVASCHIPHCHSFILHCYRHRATCACCITWHWAPVLILGKNTHSTDMAVPPRLPPDMAFVQQQTTACLALPSLMCNLEQRLFLITQYTTTPSVRYSPITSSLEGRGYLPGMAWKQMAMALAAGDSSSTYRTVPFRYITQHLHVNLIMMRSGIRAWMTYRFDNAGRPPPTWLLSNANILSFASGLYASCLAVGRGRCGRVDNAWPVPFWYVPG